MKFRKANHWEEMPKVMLFSWHGRQVLLVNWESLVVRQGEVTVAGMSLRVWWRVFSYLK